MTTELNLCGGGLIHYLLGGRTRLAVVFLIALVCWMPIFLQVFLTRDPVLYGSFANDWTVHARFLLSLPLMLIAERSIGLKTSLAAEHLLEEKIVDERSRAKVVRMIQWINHVEGGIWLDVLLLAFFVADSFLGRVGVIGLGEAAWHQEVRGAHAWFRHVAMIIYRLIFCRWVVRLLLWSTLLSNVSRMKLLLLPHHPDGAGGLAFLRWAQHSFVLLVLAMSCVLAANLYQSLPTQKTLLEALYNQVLFFYVFSVFLFLGPLLFFSPQLHLSQGLLMLKFTRFSGYCTRAFQNKWIGKSELELERNDPLGASDNSAMIDLISTHQHAQNMSQILVSKYSLIMFGFATLLPFAPAFFAAFGWNHFLKILAKLAFG